MIETAFFFTSSQIEMAAEIAASYPEMTFVLDHLGCPVDRSRAGYEAWLQGMRTMGALENCYCKISGLIHPMYTNKGNVNRVNALAVAKRGTCR